MEHLDVSIHNSAAQIKALISGLLAKNMLSPEGAESIPEDKILTFVQSKVAERMRLSEGLKREVPFVAGFTPYEIYCDEVYKENTAVILVHGIIDCFFYEDGQGVIVDYKSDKITPKNTVQLIKDKYALQLKIYRKSLERSSGLKVKECILYLFDIDDFIVL